MAGRNPEGEVMVEITYRFGPPDGQESVVGNVRNSEEFPKERKKL
jgi:hypothetical protein